MFQPRRGEPGYNLIPVECDSASISSILSRLELIDYFHKLSFIEFISTDPIVSLFLSPPLNGVLQALSDLFLFFFFFFFVFQPGIFFNNRFEYIFL